MRFLIISPSLPTVRPMNYLVAPQEHEYPVVTVS